MRDALTRRWVDLLVAAALFLVAAVMVSLHVDAYTRVSPVDELQHIDYLYIAPDSPAPGDRVGQQAMNEQACRGLDVPGHPVPPCRPRGTYDPNAFQESGFNTASVNSPVYYTLGKAVGATIEALTPVDNLVTGARLAGIVWLGGGIALLYAAARYRGAGRWAAGVVGLLLLSAPALLYPAATINPDGQALLWGSLLRPAPDALGARPGPVVGRGARGRRGARHPRQAHQRRRGRRRLPLPPRPRPRPLARG